MMRSSVAAAVPRRRQRGGERGSWYHFLTNSFHGIIGMTSFSVTLSAWIYNAIVNANANANDVSSSPPSVLASVLIILSVITSTILSIHSSWYMLEQSPQQSTILDYIVKLQRNNGSKSSSNADNVKTFNIKVVAPHREAFHQLSIIMQYANARILLLLQRQHYHFNQQISSSSSLSGVMLWGLVSLMCLRMLPIPDISKLFTITTGTNNKRRTTIADKSTDKSTDKTAAAARRKLPDFWANGNSYCFVLPMVMSVVGDFCMTAWCEYHYFYYQDNSSGQSETSSSSNLIPSNSSSLFQYHSRFWLSLWHLLFLQVAAHTIAFGFTLAFRLKHSNKNKNKNKTKFDEKDKTNSSRNDNNGNSFFFVYINTTALLNIRTLYWVCTIGVYALVVLGLVKATATIRALR